MNTQCISDLQRFEIFQNSCFFSTFWLLRNFYSCDAHHANYGKHSLNNHFQQGAHSVYDIYSVLKLFKIAVCCAHLALRNFYCGDAHHANYGKHSFNHHFQHCAHSVYQIESVLKVFETAFFFAHFCFYEISTLVMCIMLTMANIV